MCDMNPTSIELTISRDPRKLYKWIEETNTRGKFFTLSEDPQNKREVMALCVLLSRRKISFENFLAAVMDLDFFDHSDLGPLLANLELPKCPDLSDSIKAIVSVPGWKSVFEKKIKDKRDTSPKRDNGQIDH